MLEIRDLSLELGISLGKYRVVSALGFDRARQMPDLAHAFVRNPEPVLQECEHRDKADKEHLHGFKRLARIRSA